MKLNYNFFEVLENIDGKKEDGTTFPLLMKGEIVMRVGGGLVAPSLPISTLYTVPYQKLFDKKVIKLIDNEKEIIELKDVFKDLITEVKLEVSTSVLTMLETHAEFIDIPEHLTAYVKSILKLK
ncbi:MULTISPECIES: hypothetical protein [Bacteria]|uniref:hypothetical protein n=1 Tax=Bacteria TaxID=2 RepID=UPI002E7C38F3|nr:hypothetical protein [Cetobacterium somerae]WVJ03078.1 hypothetical protein VSU16_15210 [Cetobacterium somerae]